MEHNSRSRQAGFTLIEVSVALALTTAGVIGTLSLINFNRSLLEAAWAQNQMARVADSVMTGVTMRFYRDGVLPVGANYDWNEDSRLLELYPLMIDNDMTPASLILSIGHGAGEVVYEVEIIIASPATGRRLDRTLVLYAPLRP